jgi:hypothetical protein
MAIIYQPTEVLRFKDHILLVDAWIEVGMKFHTKLECAHAIKEHHFKQSLDFKHFSKSLIKIYFVSIMSISHIMRDSRMMKT